MRVEHWWRDAVLYDVSPTGGPSNGPLLQQLTAQVNDLQAMGFDAILLRAIASPGAVAANSASTSGLRSAATSPLTMDSQPAATPAGLEALPIDARYGSIEQFDGLLAEASRRRLRVIVELPASSTAFSAEARSWLSHGVSGIYVSGPDSAAAVHALRGILHGFVGERVIVGDAPIASVERAHSRVRRGSDVPDLVLTPLRGLDSTPADAPALRSSLSSSANASAVWEMAHASSATDTATARVRVTVLLSARGGAALQATDVPVLPSSTTDGDNSAGATSATVGAASVSSVAAAPDPLAEWTRRMIGLHRGNSTLRTGAVTVFDRDRDGVLAVVWRGAGGQVLIELVNLTALPVQFPLTEDIARLHLRGSFLRTVLRSDSGMGAMPLRAVSLPAYGVYLGQLSR